MSFDLSNLTTAEYDQLITDLLAKLRTSPRGVFTPIDLQNLTAITETGDWVEELPQPQEGWRLNGGAPDPANNKGIFTWLLQGYANRTRHNKNAIDLLASPETATNLDDITASRMVVVDTGVLSAPLAAGAYVEHTERGASVGARQLAHTKTGNVLQRYRDSAGAWGAWAYVSAPCGNLITHADDTPPTGWLECDGSSLSKTTYADLFAVIGTRFGSTSTTFKLPDLRGEFVRGWDHGRGIDGGRGFGSKQVGSLIIGDDGNQVNGLKLDAINDYFDAISASEYPNRKHNSTSTADEVMNHEWADAYLNHLNYWGATRPRNIALIFCIKY